MTLPEVAAIFVLVGFATGVQGSLGFGFAMVFAPLATLVVGAEMAIATSILTGSFVSALQYAEHRPRARLATIAPMVTAALAGAPVGLALLTVADETTLQLLVGVAVLVSAVVTATQRSAHSMRRPERLPLMLGAGLAGV